jgi:choline monooxygenase
MSAPVELYRDPAVFAAERSAIFAKTWQFLGLESDLVRPGDYIADVIAGFPVVAVRDETGAVRAYHNVCRHRAGPLVGDAVGRCERAFVCRYHGWRYGFDGALRSAAGFDAALDLAAYSLVPVCVETWRGFVFVNLDPAAAPLIETLGPLDARFGDRDDLSARVLDSHTVACNWKVFAEITLEGYHIEGLHPGLETDTHAGRHDLRIAGEVAMHDLEASDDGDKGLWAWVWPNLCFTLDRGVLRVEHMRPISPDSTLLWHLYLHEPEDPRVDAAHLTSERVTDEHAWICERVQQNLDAGVYRQGPLSPSHEQAVAWFQDRVTQLINL